MPYFQPWIGHNYQSSNPRVLVVGDSHYCADPCDLRSQCGVHGNLPASSMGRCQFFTQDVTRRYLDFRAGRAEAEGWMKRTILTFDKIFYGKDDVTPAESLDLWNRIAFYNFVQTATSSDPSNSNYTTDDYRRSTPHSAEVLESLQPDIILVWGTKAYDYLPPDGWSAINDVCGDYTLRSGRKARCIKLTHPSRASFASEHQKLTQCLSL